MLLSVGVARFGTWRSRSLPKSYVAMNVMVAVDAGLLETLETLEKLRTLEPSG